MADQIKIQPGTIIADDIIVNNAITGGSINAATVTATGNLSINSIDTPELNATTANISGDVTVETITSGTTTVSGEATLGETTITGNVTINGGMDTGVKGKAIIPVYSQDIQIIDNIWYNNTDQSVINVSPATWDDTAKTCHLISSIPVTLNGVTWLGGESPEFDTTQSVFEIELNQTSANLITADLKGTPEPELVGYYQPSVTNGILSWTASNPDLPFVASANITGLTAEQISTLTNYASAEGQNITIDDDRTFATQIGHTYIVTADTEEVAVAPAAAPMYSYAEITDPPGQAAFVATSAEAIVSTPNCTVTEVFRPAAPLTLSGGGVKGYVLPAGYTRVEYLEDTGTQYINTEIIISYPFSFEATASEIVGTDYYNALLGFFENSGEKRSVLLFTYCADADSVSGTIGIWTDWRRRSDFKIKEKNVIRFEADEPVTLPRTYVNGILLDIGAYSPPPYQEPLDITTQPIYLFCINRDGAADFSTFRGNVRIYEIKILCNKECHLIPCLDETGAPCLFDIITYTPFYNQGTGDFLYPTESTTYSLRRVLPDWGKLTSTGLRRLYYAPVNYQGELYDYALENGYKPIVEPEKPEEGYWIPRWTETEDEIVLTWIETDPPEPEPWEISFS